MRSTLTVLLIGSALMVVMLAGTSSARSDDGSQPFIIIDDGGTETDIPIPAGVTDPDEGNPDPAPAQPNGSDNGAAATPTAPTAPSEAPASAAATTVPVVPEATPDPQPTPRPPGFCDLTPTADVGVSASVAGGDVVQGSMVSYSLDVFNTQSPDCSAPSASLSDQLPPQLELPSADAVTTEQGSCRVEGGVGNQRIICSFGALEAGQHVKVGITARVDKTGAVSDQACVDSSATDPNRGDNQCSTAVFTATPAASSNTSTEQPSAPVTQPAPRDLTARMPSHLRLPDAPPKKELPRTLVLPE